MRDVLHRKPHRDSGCHLQDDDHRTQCDGKCNSEGDGYPCQIRPQEQYSPGHPQLCYGDQSRSLGKRFDLGED